MDAMTRRQIQALAQAAVEQAASRIGVPQATPGTVAGPGRVRPDGSLSSIPAQNLIGRPLAVGERVMILFAPPHGAFVFGEAGELGDIAIPHLARKRVDAPTASTSSTSYSDAPGPVEVVDFRKYLTDTILNVRIYGNAYNSTGGADALRFGVLVDGNDYNVAYQFFNPASTHLPVVGESPLEGLAAGTYDVRLRWRSIGGGTFNTDGNDVLRLVVEETWGEDQ